MLGYKKIIEIDGVYLFKNFFMEDCRGDFLKIFQKSKFPVDFPSIEFTECFITSSQRNVLRGMHFQKNPYAADKLVTVVSGCALDVILDMRFSSKTYGQIFSVNLGGEFEYRTIFVPAGCAHGFLALSDDMKMLYQTTCEYSPESDSGIRYDSFGFTWPVLSENLILSEKDVALPEWNKGEIIFP